MQQGKFESVSRKRAHPLRILLRILVWLLAILLCAGIVLYVIPLTETESDRTAEHSGDWMSRLDDSLPLNQIVLPGTHDSATQYVQLGFFSKCQALEIGGQLEAGFRYLDIRLGFRDGAPVLMHGFTLCKTGPLPWDGALQLEQVLEQCYAFLEEHPGETVLLAVKLEHGDETPAQLEQALEDCISEQPDRWLLTDRIPTLGQARGKLVLLRRYEDEAGLGARAGIPLLWEDQGGHEDTALNIVMSDRGGYPLWVQDRYEYGSDDKWEAFLAGIGEQQIGAGDLALHFLSTKGTLAYGHPWHFARDLNLRLLNTSVSTLRGWIILDFGNATLAEQIYSANFR